MYPSEVLHLHHDPLTFLSLHHMQSYNWYHISSHFGKCMSDLCGYSSQTLISTNHKYSRA